MVAERVHRRLAAYSRPTWSVTAVSWREDEAGTLQTLHEFRAVIDGVITEHHVCVFDSAGDGVIAELTSPVALSRPLKA